MLSLLRNTSTVLPHTLIIGVSYLNQSSDLHYHSYVQFSSHYPPVLTVCISTINSILFDLASVELSKEQIDLYLSMSALERIYFSWSFVSDVSQLPPAPSWHQISFDYISYSKGFKNV